MTEKKEIKRALHYDVLRIFAAFSVVLLHSASQYWYTLDIYSKDWLVANSYDAAFRFGVPVFVMISGALFLAPDYKIDVKRLYTHNILRMLILFAVWSCLYGLWDVRFFGFETLGVKGVLREMVMGRYHLWFLPMIIGIYMILPVLKTWVEHASRKQIEYILILFLIFQVGVWTLRALTVTDEIHYILDWINIELVCSYVGYFILGYYLAHVGIALRLKKAIYIAAVPAVLCNVILGNVIARHRGMLVSDIYDSFGIFTFIVVIALFLFVKERFENMAPGKVGAAVIKELSADMLGIYVLHIGVLEALEMVGIHSMMMNNIIAIPLLAVICFSICLVASSLLRRIPRIGKYIC